MTAPASSAPRGTALTSSASASQVTASVIKFRCLYTHDLRRKSKRWQDGYLRYHAFNKRVMVYDEPGNYIGDHHWRSNDELQDGDELELDKGALIQVGERMGTTLTDLSNLFEKRKSSQGSPQANDPASQTPRPSAQIRSSGSSQPFRSLSDLLGIKKTPIGHLVSPYEERHRPRPSSNIPESPERTLKRQKVSSIEKTPVKKQDAQAEVVDLTESVDDPLVAKASTAISGREAPRPPKDSGQNKSAPPVKNPRRVPELANSASPNQPTFVKPALPPFSDSSRSRPSQPMPSAPHTGAQRENPEARRPTSKAATSKSRPTPESSSEAPIKTLRMAIEKPRRKLMYSALLPGDISPKTALGPSSSSPASRIKTPLQEIEPTNAEFMPSDSTQFILEEMIGGPSLEPGPGRRIPNPVRAHQPLSLPRKLPARRAPDAPLRKSVSDPTALTALQSRPTVTRSALRAVPEQPEQIEEGPWTSEALDLFDFWPPGRPKPGSVV
ncbi:uncharacterized protein N7482_002995 [Penicillium canariense]|uniref:5'-3' DNA helicase ZGRF1-like N-terminal domain-containing protein n=1 Tax=Penicillium canariense TaxID=189055 RepID=A0A9W9II27_9EURO|nr:uncharacterized protein N7482_002995 [Penicillium canariense]KAJ5177118.1 hypothetical protein N7482_002995 [Penicillium canariense]